MTSVTDILKKHGTWLETSALIKKIAEELNITERQAYRKFKKAWEDKEIRKVALPDHRVLVGLPEWPPQTSSSKKPEESLNFQDAFLYRCFKQLDEINEKNVTGNSLQAFQRLCSFIKTLPSHLKDKLSPDVQQAKQVLFPYMEFLKLEEMKFTSALQNTPDYQRVQVIMKHDAYGYVEDLVEKVSMLLHGEFEILMERVKVFESLA